VTRHSTKCVDFSLAFFGFGETSKGEIEGCDVVEQVAKTTRNLFSKKEKNLEVEVERGEKKTTVTGRGGENIHLSLSFCIHTHTEFLTLISHTMATFSAAKVRI